MSSSKSRVLAVLLLPNSVPNLVKRAQGVVEGLTNNPSFPSPTPTLATVNADIAALQAAEVTALTRAHGAAAARDVKLLAVKEDLRQLKSYVQTVANAAPGNAASLIQAAGLSVERPRTYAKPPLAVKQGPNSGSVLVVARAAAGRASYDWAYSQDQKTWTSCASTLVAKTSITGLPAGSTFFFRSRALTAAGQADWGEVVSLLVK